MTAKLIKEFTQGDAEEVGVQLADAFDDLSEFSVEGSVRLLDQAGLETMGDIFEVVPASKRADVYVQFLRELDLRGIPFKRSQFTGPDG